MIKRGAVVLGGHVQGLGLIRMLGRENIPVTLVDSTESNIGRYSKYCSKFLLIPKASYLDESAFCAQLQRICVENDLKGCVVFPTDDRTVALLSRTREKLREYFIIWTPVWATVEKCYDKKETYQIAEVLGIPIPQSFFPRNRSDVETISEKIPFPCIIKPAVMHEFYEKTKLKAIIVEQKEALVKKYLEVSTVIPPSQIIIQEIIPGKPKKLYSVGTFFKNGKSVAHVVAQRVRQIPMDFGKASTLVKLCNNDVLMTYSESFLRYIDYYGLCEVEFILDPRDDIYKLLEINPRTWKWHSISNSAGVNLPYLLFQDIRGENYMEPKDDRNMNDITWIDILTDTYTSWIAIIHGELSLKEYVSSFKGKFTYSVLAKDDPYPSVMGMLLLFSIWRERA